MTSRTQARTNFYKSDFLRLLFRRKNMALEEGKTLTGKSCPPVRFSQGTIKVCVMIEKV